MASSKKKIFVVIGEASGDLHGGNVLKRIKKIAPQLEFVGTGGKLFSTISKKRFYGIEELEVIGFWEVIKNLRRLKQIFKRIFCLIEEQKPDAVFLVDYVGFNLRLAKEAKKKNIPVYFYIAPQVWAWKKDRVEQIARYVDKLIVLFPFEVDFFARHKIFVECFGHPLLDIAKSKKSKKEIFKKYKLNLNKKTILFFPGSRKQEVSAHFKILLKTAKILQKKQDLQFVFIFASEDSLENAKELCADWEKENIIFISENFYDLACYADLALACSGTVTLESCILQLPTLIFYRTSFFTYILLKYYFRVQQIGLPNIVCKKNYFPELIQNDCNPKKLSQKALEILKKEKSYFQIQEGLAMVKKKLTLSSQDNSYKKTAEFLAKEWS